MAQVKSITQPTAHTCFGAIIDPAMRNRVALTAIVSDAHMVKADKPKRKTEVEDISGKKSGVVSGSGDQSELLFRPEDKGRFNNSTPTTFRGEDLDIPTYIRRGVKLTFER